MLWFGRPPYLRWIAATSLVVAAFLWDISERATEPFPFAAVDLTRGQFLSPEDIEWRSVPTGSLVMPNLTGASAVTTIRSGDPIVPSLVSATSPIPSDSWAVPVPLPLGAGPGMSVRLVFADGSAISGVIVQPATEDTLGLISEGLVAVSGDVANSVALATANGDLIVLIEP
ncbi:MAG: SAF domain-containing protein [Acidimicrobiia bacterium]